MRTGKSIMALAEELERLQESKRDFVAPTGKLEVVLDSEGAPRIAGLMKEAPMPIRQSAHRQIAERISIPQKYYDRMLEDAPDLLVENINHWFHKEPERRMFRTLEGSVRAVLSDRYRPLDNYELASAVLPVLRESEVEVRSAEVTDTRMYIQAVQPRMVAEPVKGDVIQAGIALSNSEIGLGSLRIEPLIFRLICLNGMIAMEAIRKYHIGRRDGGEDDISELLADETRRLDDAAFWSKARDLTKASFDRRFFDRQVERVEKAIGVKVERDVEEVVEVMATRFVLGEGERKGLLTNLIRDGATSQWDIVNAMTKLAHTATDYDRSVELERFGGQVIELPKSEFAKVITATAPRR